jgi:hypothetical protein
MQTQQKWRCIAEESSYHSAAAEQLTGSIQLPFVPEGNRTEIFKVGGPTSAIRPGVSLHQYESAELVS